MINIIEATQKTAINKGLNSLDLAVSQLERGDVLGKHTDNILKLKQILREISVENDQSGYKKLGLELLKKDK